MLSITSSKLQTVQRPIMRAAVARMSSAAVNQSSASSAVPKSTLGEIEEDARPNRPPILSWAASVLSAQKTLLGRISKTDYTKVNPKFQGSVGVHMRHSINHFDTLMTSVGKLAGGDKAPVADYDSRTREERLEKDPDFAREKIIELSKKIKAIPEELLDKKLDAKFMVTADGKKEAYGATLGRELAFVTHHAIHHNAIMSWLAQELDYEVPVDFGMTNATVQHARSVDNL